MVDEERIAERMETPPELELKPSQVEEGSIGIWCRMSIQKGQKFGPFVGDKVIESSHSMDSTYVWEIVDLETREFLFYIDATDPEKGNWMRYINCARYYEEQNIVSQQEGIDIYYTAIKDIPAGEELLTWYESKPLNRPQRRPKKSRFNRSPYSSLEKKSKTIRTDKANHEKKKKKKIANKTSKDVVPAEKDEEQKTCKDQNSQSSDSGKDDSIGKKTRNKAEDNIKNSTVRDKTKKLNHVIDNHVVNGHMEESSTVLKTTKTDDVNRNVVNEMMTPEIELETTKCADLEPAMCDSVSLNKSKLAEEGKSSSVSEKPASCAGSDGNFDDSDNSLIADDNNEHLRALLFNDSNDKERKQSESQSQKEAISISSEQIPDLTIGGFYQFVLLPKQVIAGKQGRKVYKCDICLGDYRHAFSLKRHYIRNHINYKYVSQTDLLNCNISKDQQDIVNKRVRDVMDAASNETDRDIKDAHTLKKSTKKSETVESEGKAETTDGPNCGFILNVPKHISAFSKNADKKQSSEIKNTCNQTGTSEYSGNEDTSKAENRNVEDETENVKHPESEKGLNNETMTSAVNNEGHLPPVETFPNLSGLYRCNICDQLFQTKETLLTHSDEHKDLPNENLFSCDQCDGKFSHKQNLMRHKQTIHSGMKPFTCAYCGKNFSSLTNQKRHERIHQGQKFPCNYCQRTFTQSGDLKKHVRRFHAEHYYECQFCGKYYLSMDELDQHLTCHDEAPTYEPKIQPKKKELDHVDPEDISTDKKEEIAIDHIDGLFNSVDSDVKFMCSVCHKEFTDYQVMCRHQRMTHRHNMIDSHHVKRERSSITNGNQTDKGTVNVSKISDHEMQAYEERSKFYSNVAENIADNLNHYIDGKEEHLGNFKAHIKCELTEPNSPTKMKQDGLLLSKYNFPNSFSSNSCENSVNADLSNINNNLSDKVGTDNSNGRVLSAKTHESLSRDAPVLYSMICSNNIPADANAGSAAILSPPPLVRKPDSPPITTDKPEQSPSYHSEDQPPPLKHKPEPSKPSIGDETPSAKTLPIRVPQIHTCVRCKCIFHNSSVYADHMMQRHNVDVNGFTSLVLGSSSSSALIGSPALSPSTPSIGEDPSLLRTTTASPMVNVPISHDVLDYSNHSSKYIASDTLKLETTPGTNRVGSACFSESLQLKTSSSSEFKSQMSNVSSETLAGQTCDEKSTPPANTADFTKFVCNVCNHECASLSEILSHQKKDHRNIECTYVEVDKNFTVPLAYMPSSQGLLASTPAITLSTEPDVKTEEETKLTCTKCSQNFSSLPQFHRHILDCAGHWKRPNKKKRKYKKRAKNGNKVTTSSPPGLSEITDESSQDGLHMKYRKGVMQRQQFKKNKKRKMEEAEGINTGADLPDVVEDEASRKRRRNFELLYNPQNHVRRRELINVLDMHKCNGCSLRFESISNLERHIKVCSKKDQLQNMPAMKTSLSMSSQQHENKLMRHKCKICNKQFTYHGSLRKHVNSSCGRLNASAAVNYDTTQYGENNSSIDMHENYSENGDSIDGESDKREKGRGGWPKGRKRKGKRRNHGWGYSRKKMPNGDTSVEQNSPEMNGDYDPDISPEHDADIPPENDDLPPTSSPDTSKQSDEILSEKLLKDLGVETTSASPDDAVAIMNNPPAVEEPIEPEQEIHTLPTTFIPTSEENTEKKIKRKRKPKNVEKVVRKKRKVNVLEENPYKRMYRRRSSTKTVDEDKIETVTPVPKQPTRGRKKKTVDSVIYPSLDGNVCSKKDSKTDLVSVRDSNAHFTNQNVQTGMKDINTDNLTENQSDPNKDIHLNHSEEKLRSQCQNSYQVDVPLSDGSENLTEKCCLDKQTKCCVDDQTTPKLETDSISKEILSSVENNMIGIESSCTTKKADLCENKAIMDIKTNSSKITEQDTTTTTGVLLDEKEVLTTIATENNIETTQINRDEAIKSQNAESEMTKLILQCNTDAENNADGLSNGSEQKKPCKSRNTCSDDNHVIDSETKRTILQSDSTNSKPLGVTSDCINIRTSAFDLQNNSSKISGESQDRGLFESDASHVYMEKDVKVTAPTLVPSLEVNS